MLTSRHELEPRVGSIHGVQSIIKQQLTAVYVLLLLPGCSLLISNFSLFFLVIVVPNTYLVLLRACVNDVPKIKIGKNQNQNWALIGRGLKPPDYASLFFGNRCQTKEVPRDLMFIFRKINIGGVHLIEGFPNATRQRPEHSRVTTAARRQTAPPHNTHNFCWHGPRQRSHGEGNR